jgi:thiamine kinase-like enzyme
MNKYYKIPISYYHLYLRKGSRDGEEFTKKKLNLYKNWKRQLVLWALKFKLLPRKKIDSNADIIFLGNRKKEIYFDKKKIITCGDCKTDYENRKKMNRYFNCIKNPKYTKEKLEEDLIWPTRKITDKDIVRVFEELVDFYKKNLKNKSMKEIIKEKEKRLNKKINVNNKNIKLPSTIVHGDFWKGNLEKDKDGKIWIFDWGQSGMGGLIEDVYNYFLIEYFSTKRLNERLLVKIIKMYEREFDFNLNKINSIEREINSKMGRDLETFNKFNNILINLTKKDFT